MMNRNLVCILCPRGCSLTAKQEDGVWSVTGNTCPRGEKYGIDECTNPVRTVTSILRISNRDGIMVSVKTSAPIAKGRMYEAMERIRSAAVAAPVRIGDVLLHDVCGADIIATKNID